MGEHLWELGAATPCRPSARTRDSWSSTLLSRGSAGCRSGILSLYTRANLDNVLARQVRLVTQCAEDRVFLVE